MYKFNVIVMNDNLDCVHKTRGEVATLGEVENIAATLALEYTDCSVHGGGFHTVDDTTFLFDHTVDGAKYDPVYTR